MLSECNFVVRAGRWLGRLSAAVPVWGPPRWLGWLLPFPESRAASGCMEARKPRTGSSACPKPQERLRAEMFSQAGKNWSNAQELSSLDLRVTGKSGQRALQLIAPRHSLRETKGTERGAGSGRVQRPSFCLLCLWRPFLCDSVMFSLETESEVGPIWDLSHE